MLFIQPSSAKCFVGCHPGLALIGGKRPGLGLFVRKGGQIQSLELSQASQICCLLHDDDCKLGVDFPGGGPLKSSPLRAGRGACPGGRETAFTALCALREKVPGLGIPGQCSKGSNALVRGKLHPDLALLGTIQGLLLSAKLAQTLGLCCSRALSLSGFKSPPAFLFLWAHLPSSGTSTSKLCREKCTANFFKQSWAF